MKVRILSLLLTVVLVLALIPVSASAAGKDAAAIEQQIKTTFRTALRSTGRSSFNGFCGSFVNWQTYILGIDDHVYGCDGKDEYDLYRDMGTTTGGYRVKCYPAGQYDLRSALNAITNNGTVDAYNILVGFQRTNTTEGSIYGHAVLIHAILDGEVFFAESYTTSIGGTYWAEGAPIRVSIDTFCDSYNSWTVFDGIAYFGIKSYADLCTEYPAAMYARAAKDLEIYEEPCDPGVNEEKKTGDILASGEIVQVTGLLQTPGCGYWYRLGHMGFVPADELTFIQNFYDDVQATQVKFPATVNRGAGFVLQGTVSSLCNQLTMVEVSVYSAENMQEMLLGGSVETAGNAFSLSSNQMDRQLTFRKLQAGNYVIIVRAKVMSYIMKNGELEQRTETVEVYRSELQVITRWAHYCTLTFDANGGRASLNQKAVVAAQSVGKLPAATLLGYVFAGWSLDQEGKEMVNSDTSFGKHTTLYAQWVPSLSSHSAGQQKNDTVCFNQNEKPAAWIAFQQRTYLLYPERRHSDMELGKCER